MQLKGSCSRVRIEELELEIVFDFKSMSSDSIVMVRRLELENREKYENCWSFTDREINIPVRRVY